MGYLILYTTYKPFHNRKWLRAFCNGFSQYLLVESIVTDPLPPPLAHLILFLKQGITQACVTISTEILEGSQHQSCYL